jgi:hypothetical protein
MVEKRHQHPEVGFFARIFRLAIVSFNDRSHLQAAESNQHSAEIFNQSSVCSLRDNVKKIAAKSEEMKAVVMVVVVACQTSRTMETIRVLCVLNVELALR